MGKTVAPILFGVLWAVIQAAIQPHDIAPGHERNQAKIMAAQLSAPITVLVRIGCTVHFQKDIPGIPVEFGKNSASLYMISRKADTISTVKIMIMPLSFSIPFVSPFCFNIFIGNQKAQGWLMPFDCPSTAED